MLAEDTWTLGPAWMIRIIHGFVCLSVKEPVVHIEDWHVTVDGEEGEVGLVEVCSSREDGSTMRVNQTRSLLSSDKVGWGVDQHTHLKIPQSFRLRKCKYRHKYE